MTSTIARTLNPEELARYNAGIAALENLTLPEDQKALIRKLLEDGKKIGVDEVQRIWKLAEERIASTKGLKAHTIWIETGDEKAGFNHIDTKHGAEFAKAGINGIELIEVAEATTKVGTHVGFMDSEARQKKRGGPPPRPIYLLIYKGQPLAVAISVGNNGFVVGMNKHSWEQNIGKVPDGPAGVGVWPELPPLPDRVKDDHWTWNETGYAHVQKGVVGERHPTPYPVGAWAYMEPADDWKWWDQKGNCTVRRGKKT